MSVVVTTPQENAEKSKDQILNQFSTSVHKLSDQAVNTSYNFSVLLAVTVFVIAMILVILLGCLLFVYGYYDITTIILVVCTILILLAVVLIIAVDMSTVSMKRKSTKLADNAVTLLSSEQAIVLLNNVAKVYNDNTT
jgi:hypothetical protein